jgi:hypothetical protein
MSDDVSVELQHFRVTDPDFVRFLSCFDREEPITDRHSVGASSLSEAAAEAHPSKDQVDDGQVAIGDLHGADYQDLSSDLEEDVCMYQSVNQDDQYSDGGSDCTPDDEALARIAMSFNSVLDMDMSDRDDEKSDYSDDGSLYEYPVKSPHPVKSHSSDHGSDSEYQDESSPPVEKPSESNLQISVIERQMTQTTAVGVVDNGNESPSTGDHFDEPQYFEDLEGSSDDGLEDAMLVPRAKATKSPLSRVRSGRVTKSGTSSSAKSRVRSASVEELVTSDQALPDPALPDPQLPDSESPVRCPVEGCNWFHGMKGGKKSPQGSLCHHIKYFAFRGSTDPKKAAVDKAHREVHDQMKEDRSKSHQIHFVPRP